MKTVELRDECCSELSSRFSLSLADEQTIMSRGVSTEAALTNNNTINNNGDNINDISEEEDDEINELAGRRLTDQVHLSSSFPRRQQRNTLDDDELIGGDGGNGRNKKSKLNRIIRNDKILSTDSGIEMIGSTSSGGAGGLSGGGSTDDSYSMSNANRSSTITNDEESEFSKNVSFCSEEHNTRDSSILVCDSNSQLYNDVDEPKNRITSGVLLPPRSHPPSMIESTPNIIMTDHDQKQPPSKLTSEELALVNRCQSPQKNNRFDDGDGDGLPKIINRKDGLKNSMYYFDENGSPKLRDPSVLNRTRRKQLSEEKDERRKLQTESSSSCACFSFSKLKKKIKDFRK